MKFRLAIIFTLIHLLSYAQDRDKVLVANEYFTQGEYDKALVLYEELSQNKFNYHLIYRNYIQLLHNLDRLDQAEKFLVDANRKFVGNIQYQSMLAFHYSFAKKSANLSTYLSKLKKDMQSNSYHLALLAQQFSSLQLYSPSIDFFLEARILRNDPTVYALELASLYRLIDKKDLMIEEYLTYGSISSNRLNYVKNLLQNYFKHNEELEELEDVLIIKMQEFPENIMYPELLIWLELQRKNFYSAFIQAKAIDRRLNQEGDRSMQIGKIAFDNNYFEDASDIFNYISNTYPDGKNYPTARRLNLEAEKSFLTNSFPVDTLSIRNLCNAYFHLYVELGTNNSGYKALRSKAHLHAFYLDEIDSAKTYLNRLVSDPRAGRMLSAEAKLELGDIYILTNEPWEATLLYSQVEKSFKSHPLGYESKLRNARLNYFTGNFQLAKRHLDILKRNTTREISNDAIDLGILISTNTALDTTDLAMQAFANAELLIFQNKRLEAEKLLIKMLDEYQNHSLTDEIYWELSLINIEKAAFEKSIEYLENITTKYSYDILADDAAFKMAEIYHYHLNHLNTAKELYKEFMISYPGSKYVAKARDRFRSLRGDFLN